MNTRFAVVVALSIVASSASAQIYKTVDANGNVVYTDIAPIERSGQPPPQEVNVQPSSSPATQSRLN